MTAFRKYIIIEYRPENMSENLYPYSLTYTHLAEILLIHS